MEEFDFIELFKKKLREKAPNWHVKGILDEEHNIITLGTDSKLVGRIFELKCNSLLKEIEIENPGYELKKPDTQTEYPDFYYVCPDGKRIAVDIKTSYLDINNPEKRKRKTDIWYTLGSYKSFLQDEEKNISGNYGDYKLHYVIGFVYERLYYDDGCVMTYSDENFSKISCPYGNVRVWVQEKYKITGTTEKSGDTTNIGSITSKNIDDFQMGRGPFSELEKCICEDYWRNFKKDTTYRSVEKYFAWAKEHSTLELNLEEQEAKYINWRRLNKPTDEDKIIMAERVIKGIGRINRKDKFLFVQRGGEEEKIANAGSKKYEELLQFCLDNSIAVDVEIR